MTTLPASLSTSKNIIAETTIDTIEDIKKEEREEREEKVIPCFLEIEKLQEQGINVADINKLKSAGFCTLLSLIQTTRKELCNIKGLSEVKVEKILEASAKIGNYNTFITANELIQKRNRVLKITTGSNVLDLTLGGGIESVSITELFGENRSGKTQICHTLTVTAQLPKYLKGGNGKVCYLDTEGTFRPEKICKIAERFGLNGSDVLDNILYARAFTHEHLYQLLIMISIKMSEERFALLVVDSIISLFRVDFSGRGELSERQQKLNKTMSILNKLSEQFNVAVLITNQVMSDPGANMTFVANPMKPVGGHVIGHASTTRLSLRKGKGDQRICKVYDAPNLPEVECVFQLSDTGIIDAIE